MLEFMYPVFTGMPDGVIAGDSGLCICVPCVIIIIIIICSFLCHFSFGAQGPLHEIK